MRLPLLQAKEEYQRVAPRRIPGYGGVVRGSQHLQGFTFGQTARASDTDPTNMNAKMPNAPNQNRGVVGGPLNRMPGYTGFVPGGRDAYGHTYGQTTKEL